MSSDHSKVKKVMNIKEISKIIPHRYPFLLIDKVLDIDLELGTIVGQKNLTINEAFFQGHFPDQPIMPGVLMLEALAQLGGVLVHLKSETQKLAVLLNIANAKFRSAAYPGDVLILKCEGVHISPNGGRVVGKIFVEDKVIVQAEMGFALVNKAQI